MPHYGSSPLLLAAAATICLSLSACGGVSVDSASSAPATGTSSASVATSNGGSQGSPTGSSSSSSSSSSSGGKASSSSGSSSGASSSSGSSSSGSSSGSTSGGGTSTIASAAAGLASKLGMPNRLLVGLGAQGTAGVLSAVLSQNLKPSIYERYLGGVGAGDWTTWDSPAGAYVTIVTGEAESIGAVPMFTLYQMAANGAGNLSGLSSSSFMSAYWANVKLLFQMIAAYGRPTLVNLEPDFWGFAQKQATGGDPTKLFAYVNTNPDCASLSNDVVGIAGCLMAMAHKYAPKAFVGFPPSDWGAPNKPAAVIAFMNAIGAQHADFIVAQTLDRDAGCFETMSTAYSCSRNNTASGWYLDETNTTTPNYSQHLAKILTWHNGIGGLPVIWWQTPLGVPSSATGGSAYHFRNNTEHYFLTHASELTAVGGLAVVFGTGENHQTNITTDGGQFQALSSAYLGAPAAIP